MAKKPAAKKMTAAVKKKSAAVSAGTKKTGKVEAPVSASKDAPEPEVTPDIKPNPKVEAVKNPPTPLPPPPPQISVRPGGMVFGVVMTIAILSATIVGGWMTRAHWWGYVEPYLPAREDTATDKLLARVTAIEVRIADQVSESSTDTAFVELQRERDRLSADLAEAVARLEKVEAALDDVERMASAVALDGSADAMKRSLDALADRLRTLEASGAENADLTGVMDRLLSVEHQIESGTSGDTSTAALVLSIGQLREAMQTGSPFEDGLEVVSAATRAIAEVRPHIAVLEPLAQSGVKTMQDLQASFEIAVNEAVTAVAVPEEDNWTAQTLQQLKSTVRIRRTGDVGEPGTIEFAVGHARNSLSAGDLAGAVSQVTKLQGPATDAMALWIADATARLQVESALDALHDLAIKRLMIGQG